MSRFAWLGLAVVALAAAPASAATYTGKLFGTITDGTADYIDLTNSTPGAFFRIAGYPIEIDFVSVVTKNYVDSKNILIPTYVSSHADISIKIPPPLGSLNENFSNDTNINLFQGSDFFGTARDGFFNLGGTTPDGNFQGGIVLNFQGAAPTFGSLTGNGVGNATIHDTVAEMQDVTSFSFTLDHGFVFATGTPEPEAWALMILGFGLVGGMLRRREHVEPVGLTAN